MAFLFRRLGLCGMLVLALLVTTTACRKTDKLEAQRRALGDNAPAMPEKKAEQVAIEQAGAPVEAPPAAEPERPKSRFHPAAFERDYELISRADISTNDDEAELVGMLAQARTGEKAWKVIRKSPEKYFEFLYRALRASNREVRVQAAVIMGLLKDKSEQTTIKLTDAVLLDQDPDVRAIAAKAFIAIRTKAAVDVLTRSLNEDPYEAARANAAWALGDIGDETAVPHLRKAMSDEDTFVRLRAVSAVKKMKAKSALPELVERLSDKSPMVVDRAEEALVEISGLKKGKDPAKWKKALGIDG